LRERYFSLLLLPTAQFVGRIVSNFQYQTISKKLRRIELGALINALILRPFDKILNLELLDDIATFCRGSEPSQITVSKKNGIGKKLYIGK